MNTERQNYQTAKDLICNSFEALEVLGCLHDSVSLREIQMMLSSMNIIRFLSLLQQDMAAVEELARKSYLHENGFYKLTILDNPIGRIRMRLHLWSANVNVSSVENIHNHRFNYFSHLLAGTLLNKIWKITLRGAEFKRYKYYPRLLEQSYALDYCGESRLENVQETKYRIGDTYWMDAREFHTVNVEPGTDALTLFVEDRSNLRSYADVFSNRYFERTVFCPANSLKPSEYITLLIQIIALIRVNQARSRIAVAG
jgi:hypothetical protein